jgi:hypothetical protein
VRLREEVAEMVKVGASVRAVGRTEVETVVSVVNVYGATVQTKEGNVYFLGEYVVVNEKTTAEVAK